VLARLAPPPPKTENTSTRAVEWAQAHCRDKTGLLTQS
jgi:hypothetical protein